MLRWVLPLVLLAIAAAATAGVLVSREHHEAKNAGPPQPAWRTIGQSVQGRPILAATFGTGADKTLVIGGVHGNEFGSAVATQFADYLAAHPESIPSGSEIDVIQCLNPDGQAAQTRGNANGVDLNRNFPSSNWRARLKPGDPSRQEGLTGGTAPASEPETQALVTYLQRGYARVVALHSHGGYIDYNGPGGRALARLMSKAAALPVQTTAYQSAIGGSLGTYVPWRYRIPVLTIEMNQELCTPQLRSGLLSLAALPE